MKEIWVKADPWKKELVTTALESGADAVVVPTGKTADVKALGLIPTVSEDGDLVWGKDVTVVDIRSLADENEVIRESRQKKVIVRTNDWTIIPLENLVAQTGNIFVEVNDLESAKTSLGILEKGVDGLIITAEDPLQVKEMINEIRSDITSTALVSLKVNRIRPLAMGDRVCVDTCTLMRSGEGCLVGNSSRALFLIHAESIENPYVSPRPFRVNAGPVHAYIMVPGGKTKYLSELKAGDEVIKVDEKGRTASVVVGRVKIERRPLLLVEATGPKGDVSVILQNAETIRLVGVDGKAVSVIKLKPGDEVLGYWEDAARHFGHQVTETITEK